MDALMIEAPGLPLFLQRFSLIRSTLATLRFLYVASFAITLVNPAFAGRTIYLYLLLPALDLEFIAKLLQFKTSVRRITVFLSLLLLLIFSLHDAVFTLKYLLVLYQVVYLLFLCKKNLANYLFFTLIAHVAFALLQMWMFFIRPELVMYVSPDYLASLIWGSEYATATFANFGFEFLLPRFSGLYRESAFFAAYLMALFLFFSTEEKFRFRRTAFVLIFIGIVLSFSKISAAILIIIVLASFKKYFNKVPLFVSAVGYLIIFHFIARYAFDKIFNTYAYDAFGTNISIMHRLLSYYGLQYFDVWNLFFGVGDYSVMPSAIRGIVDTLFIEIGGLSDAFVFCGLAGILYKGGIIGLAMFIIYLMYLGVKTSPFLILLFLTFSVTLDTLQSFVILGWYYAVQNTWFSRGFLDLFHNGNNNNSAMTLISGENPL